MRRDPDLQTCVIHWLFNARRELSIYFIGTNRPFRPIETLLETINAQIGFVISVSVHGSTQWWTWEACNLLCFVEVGYCWILTQIIGVLHWFVVMINQPILPIFFTFHSPALDYPSITPLPIKKHWLKWWMSYEPIRNYYAPSTKRSTPNPSVLPGPTVNIAVNKNRYPTS